MYLCTRFYCKDMSIIQFIKNWTLPISMCVGALSYFIYTSIPALAPTRHCVEQLIGLLQPTLIFAMLFITFCKVEPKDLRPCRWHGWLLAIQAGSFALLSLLVNLFPDMPGEVLVEGAMLCMICPTATAAAVVTGKLGGNAAHLTTYTILINLVTALIVPVCVPLIHPHGHLTFGASAILILSKVFPLLFCPFLAALAVRYFLPPLHRLVLRCKDLAFYLWAVALAIAIAVTVKSIVHSQVSFGYQAGIAAVSLLCCIFQFLVGKRIGTRYGDTISSGQALGQKNTVFAIWMGYTFMTPITSIAGGFYSVWHNIFNSYQLYRKRKEEHVGKQV